MPILSRTGNAVWTRSAEHSGDFMTRRVVYVVCAEGDDALAAQLAGPLHEAGYEVAHNGTIAIGESRLSEAEKAIASGLPIILCATARAVGSGWSHRIINAAYEGG